MRNDDIGEGAKENYSPQMLLLAASVLAPSSSAATAPLTQHQALPALQGLILPRAQRHIPAVSLAPAPASVRLSGGQTSLGTDEPKPWLLSFWPGRSPAGSTPWCLGTAWGRGQGRGGDGWPSAKPSAADLVLLWQCLLYSLVPAPSFSQYHQCSVHPCSGGVMGYP